MKNRVIVLGTILSLLAVMALPMAASAEDTVVTGQIAGTPVVTSLSLTSGNPGQAATLITITGSGFEDTGDTTVTMDGPGLTITESTYVNATTVTFKLAIAAGATATAGLRDVTVTQNGQSGTGTDLFTVNAATTISAPGAFSIGYMSTASPSTGSSGDGSVTSNGTSWVVTATGGNSGYMVSGVTPLTNKFQISKTASNYVNADSPGLSYSAALGDTNLKFYYSQSIDAADAPGSYTITITYTISDQ